MDAINSMPEQKGNFDTILDNKPVVAKESTEKANENLISVKAAKEMSGTNEEKVQVEAVADEMMDKYEQGLIFEKPKIVVKMPEKKKVVPVAKPVAKPKPVVKPPAPKPVTKPAALAQKTPILENKQ